MKNKFRIIVLCMLIMFGITVAYTGEKIPEGLDIADEFKPGIGAPVGRVMLVQGEVIIIHEEDILIGYRAKENLSLFQGDIIITGKEGRIRLELNDKSIMTLASETKLVINQSVFDPQKKDRSAFISMGLGKVRFTVRSVAEFKHSDFKVKTRTAIIGVRGSDYIVVVTENATEVTALEKTALEVISLIGPEDRKELIDFERIIIAAGALPSATMPVPEDEINTLMQDFVITEDIVSAAPSEVPEITGAITEQEAPLPTVEIEAGIIVPEVELIQPEDVQKPETAENIEEINIRIQVIEKETSPENIIIPVVEEEIPRNPQTPEEVEPEKNPLPPFPSDPGNQ